MKIKVIEEKCQGHNRCFVVASELFELDEYSYAHEVNDGIVPPELEEKARLAIANCPEQAIVEVEDGEGSGLRGRALDGDSSG